MFLMLLCWECLVSVSVVLLCTVTLGLSSFLPVLDSSVTWSTASYIHLASLYGTFSALIRTELSTTTPYLFADHHAASYCRTITAHGLGMVFLFIMPGLISTVGNFAIPQSLALLDFATPRLNNLAFWVSVVAVEVLVIAISSESGLAAGWTLYFPLTGSEFSSTDAVSLAVLSLHLLGVSSEAGAITFLATAQLARQSSATTAKWDLLVWAILVTSVLLITTLPVLGAGITLLFLERHLGNASFGNALSFDTAADSLAFQHLFWFFGHPEVYVIILPAFGIMSHLVECLRAHAVPSQTGMIIAIWSIGIVGYFVWAHHMFTTGMTDSARMYFSAATLVIGVPTAVKIFSWTASFLEITLRSTEFIVAVAFVTCFVAGGFTGLILANAAIDLAYHDTYFVVAHFHYVLSIAAAIGLLGFMLRYVSTLSASGEDFMGFAIVFFVLLAGVNVLFLLQHIVGLEGHPRRVFVSSELYAGMANISNSGFFAVIVCLSVLVVPYRPAAVSVIRGSSKFIAATGR